MEKVSELFWLMIVPMGVLTAEFVMAVTTCWGTRLKYCSLFGSRSTWNCRVGAPSIGDVRDARDELERGRQGVLHVVRHVRRGSAAPPEMPNWRMGWELGSKVWTVGGLMPDGQPLRTAPATRVATWLATAFLSVLASKLMATRLMPMELVELMSVMPLREESEVLDDLRDLLVDDARGRAGERGDHEDDGDVDGGQEVDAEAEHRDDAEDHDGDEDADGEDVARDGEVDRGVDPVEDRGLDIAEASHGATPAAGWVWPLPAPPCPCLFPVRWPPAWLPVRPAPAPAAGC